MILLSQIVEKNVLQITYTLHISYKCVPFSFNLDIPLAQARIS
jgi:hypothetical protein